MDKKIVTLIKKQEELTKKLRDLIEKTYPTGTFVVVDYGLSEKKRFRITGYVDPDSSLSVSGFELYGIDENEDENTAESWIFSPTDIV